MQPKISENKHTADIRLTILEYKNATIESLITDLKSSQTRIESKIDSLFIHFDNKFNALNNKIESSDNKAFNLFMIVAGISVGGFLILAKKVYGI